MKTFLLFFTILLTTLNTQAHSVDLSSMVLVEQENHTWTLQVRASLDAFRKEVKTHFSETPYQTPEEFKSQLLQYFSSTLKISVNDNQNIALNYGSVKLGHETTVFFDQIELPADINSIKVTGDIFKDIYKSKIRLLIIKDGFEKKSFILDHKNNYIANLMVRENAFFIADVDKKDRFSFASLLAIPFLIIALLILVILFRKSKFARLQLNN